MKNVVDRFLAYASYDTQSDENSSTYPSTSKQKALGRLLTGELQELGIEASFDEEFGYVYAVIPASEGCENAPAIGFIAHMDTSPAVSGENVKPRFVENYDGSDVVLDEAGTYVLSPATYPEMLHYIGKTLIVTDGSTLLGADDKAGISEIMTMAERLVSDPSIKHGKICIGFTPDEEVGGGVDHFDVARFGADYGFTVDGGGLGELEFENFNAASAVLTFHGLSVHPGEARHKLQNAILMAQEFVSLLPSSMRPEETCQREGFYMVADIKGSVDEAQMVIIVREHSSEKFAWMKKFLEDSAAFFNTKYGRTAVELVIKDSYYNMIDQVLPEHSHLIANACKVYEDCGVAPIIVPIRGGTDGARLSFMGLPCPNLNTGGHNFHGRFEYCVVESMETICEILTGLASCYADPEAMNRTFSMEEV